MVVQATVQNGVAVPMGGQSLPEGAQVTILVPGPGETDNGSLRNVQNQSNDARPRTLAERFKDVIGKATSLPPDMAEQHDHYVHGTPKR